MNFFVITNLTSGGLAQEGISGGDRIGLALIKKWAKSGNRIKIFIGKCGQKMYRLWQAENIEIVITSSFCSRKFSYPRLFIFEILSFIGGCWSVLKIKELAEAKTIIYSASDFWPDTIPAFILKLKFHEIKWIAGFYMFAPQPWRKDSPYRADLKKWLVGSLYWLTQLPTYHLVKRYADIVFVTSEPDVDRFITEKRNRERILVIRGGVETKEAKMYLKSSRVIPLQERKYDAVFVGRFHHQKGVLELIDIWKLVCGKKPTAKLAMIGVGSLEGEVKDKIEALNIGDKIDLLGFKDGAEKYEIFKQSKIVVHPATYDSGGMAACEAMAWGLPGVSFDLEALKTYYPQGMLKTPCFDLERFAENIIKLSTDEELYSRLSGEAVDWAGDWDWDKRADEILEEIRTKL